MLGQELIWVLKALVLPPGGLVLLGLIGLFLGCRRFLGGSLIVLSLAGLYLLSTPFIAGRLVSLVETYPALSERAIGNTGAKVIVVLGGGRSSDAQEYRGDTVNRLTLQRLRYAAWLSRRTGLPVIPSGGSTEEGEVPEAQMARQVLEQEFGVKVAAIEARSRTTWENAAFTTELLENLSLSPAILVTHAMHMPRAVSVFQRAGATVIPAPTGFLHKDAVQQGQEELTDWLPSHRALSVSYYALHEQLGRLWYSLQPM